MISCRVVYSCSYFLLCAEFNVFLWHAVDADLPFLLLVRVAIRRWHRMYRLLLSAAFGFPDLGCAPCRKDLLAYEAMQARLKKNSVPAVPTDPFFSLTDPSDPIHMGLMPLIRYQLSLLALLDLIGINPSQSCIS